MTSTLIIVRNLSKIPKILNKLITFLILLNENVRKQKITTVKANVQSTEMLQSVFI